MKSQSKGSVKYIGKLAVATGKKYGNDYTVVLGRITGRKIPQNVGSSWDKIGERMYDRTYPGIEKISTSPVDRDDKTDGTLEFLEFKHPYSFLPYRLKDRSVNEDIVPGIYGNGFRLDYLALITFGEEEVIMDKIFPPESIEQIRKPLITQWT